MESSGIHGLSFVVRFESACTHAYSLPICRARKLMKKHSDIEISVSRQLHCAQ